MCCYVWSDNMVGLKLNDERMSAEGVCYVLPADVAAEWDEWEIRVRWEVSHICLLLFVGVTASAICLQCVFLWDSLPHFLNIPMFCLSFRTTWLWTEFNNIHFWLQQNFLNSNWYAMNIVAMYNYSAKCTAIYFYRFWFSNSLCCWFDEVGISVLLVEWMIIPRKTTENTTAGTIRANLREHAPKCSIGSWLLKV